MDLHFFKYQGTGNDFILFDNRDGQLKGDEHDYFARLCHRHFGIGADGVILLNPHPDYDFEMDYFNADGQRSTMCGNGGRCMTRFAADLGLIQSRAHFLAIDGPHFAALHGDTVKLKMTLPHDYQQLDNGDYWIHTGSPHYVKFLDQPLDTYPVFTEGRAIRNSPPYAPQGTNVNFVYRRFDNELQVRTYERGVEDETLSCGTGVTAVAEVMARIQDTSATYTLHTPGGILQVQVQQGQEPWLQGPATQVFKGIIPGPY